MLLAITNRKLCEESFLERIEKIAIKKPWGIVLREKDLEEQEYKKLAERVISICQRNEVPCILHTYWRLAAELECRRVHLPFPILRQCWKEIAYFSLIGASVHSLEEAVEAEKMGASYLIAGHIFPTDCKKGVPPRGLEFLEKVCKTVNIPVFAIGGMTLKNAALAEDVGAFGICMMSGVMRTKNGY